MVIWKSELGEPNINGIIKLSLPENAQILSFGLEDNDKMVVWYSFDKKEVILTETRVLRIVNTDEPFTQFYNNGAFVFHNTLKTSNGIVRHCFARY